MSEENSNMKAHIHVAVATFRRASLEACLRSLVAQQLPDGVRLSIIVADNDAVSSAQPLVRAWAAKAAFPIDYCHAPARNIARARNACLDAISPGKDQWIAFIDDDEMAPPDWLARLYGEAQKNNLTAIFGPSKALYPADAPPWMRVLKPHENIPKTRGGQVKTGHTCNGLLQWCEEISDLRFDEAFGLTGGEDTDFFFRLHRRGARFGLSKVAVEEPVEPVRLSDQWLMIRERRQGQSYARHAAQNWFARQWISLSASLKWFYCRLRMIGRAEESVGFNYWRLRAAFHAGAASALINTPMQQLYGH